MYGVYCASYLSSHTAKLLRKADRIVTETAICSKTCVLVARTPPPISPKDFVFYLESYPQSSTSTPGSQKSESFEVSGPRSSFYRSSDKVRANSLPPPPETVRINRKPSLCIKLIWLDSLSPISGGENSQFATEISIHKFPVMKRKEDSAAVANQLEKKRQTHPHQLKSPMMAFMRL